MTKDLLETLAAMLPQLQANGVRELQVGDLRVVLDRLPAKQPETAATPQTPLAPYELTEDELDTAHLE